MFLSQVSRHRIIVSGALFCCSVLVSGCGIDAIDHTPIGTQTLHGLVHGGQQPVSGATIQLYTVGNATGSAGNGSMATPMLTRAVSSQGDGTFDLTGAYTCGQSYKGDSIGSPSDQVYIVASDGDPGLTPAANNPALVLVAALGDCANLSTLSYVEINEITTAAAAWALAPFAASYTHIGASTSNVSGIENAFLDAALLADVTTGQPATLASNLTVESAKLITLANALGSCVNSKGDSVGCSPLFMAATPTGSLVAPTDTFAAALNIVKNPGENVVAVFMAAGSKPPFAGALPTWPNDWTMSLTVTGGGLADPTGLAIDADNNVWVAGYSGPLSAFNAQGTPLSATGYGAGVLDLSLGIAIDTNGDIWVTNNQTSYSTSGSVSKFLGVNAPAGSVGTVVESGGNSGFVNGIYFPYAVSADTNGNVFIANNQNGTVTALNSTGSIYTNADNVSGYQLGGDLDAFPNDVAVDLNDGFWIPDGNRSVIHVTADGVSKKTSCCYSPWGVATDSFGNVWIANFLNNSFSEVSATGSLPIPIYQSTVGGVNSPQYVAVDAAQNVWISNSGNGSISEIAGNGGQLPAGTAISPTIGAYTTGGYGLDAGMNRPNYIAPDRSGNIWVASEGTDSVTMFFGLSTPTVTPVRPAPVAP